MPYLPALLRPQGHVIWTPRRSEHELTPTVRDWFDRAGFTGVAFDREAGLPNGVATDVLATEA